MSLGEEGAREILVLVLLRFSYRTCSSIVSFSPSLLARLTCSSKGLLSAVGDPVGQVLDKSLKPTVGRITGGVGRPTGEAAERVHNVARNEHAYSRDDNDLPDEEKPGGKRIGGNAQNGQNPLGL